MAKQKDPQSRESASEQYLDLKDPKIFEAILDKAKEALDYGLTTKGDVDLNNRYPVAERANLSVKDKQDLNRRLREQKKIEDRPPNVTDAQRSQVLAAIRHGADLLSACRIARLRVQEVKQWIARGQVEDTGWYYQFWEDYEHALGVLGSLLSARVIAAGARPAQWKANVYLGRARVPDSFIDLSESEDDRPQRLGPGSGTIVQVVQQCGLPPEKEATLRAVSIEELEGLVVDGSQ